MGASVIALTRFLRCLPVFRVHACNHKDNEIDVTGCYLSCLDETTNGGLQG